MLLSLNSVLKLPNTKTGCEAKTRRCLYLHDNNSVVPVLSIGTKSNSSTSNFILIPVLEVELEQ